MNSLAPHSLLASALLWLGTVPLSSADNGLTLKSGASLSIPAEGRWTIGLGWEDEWPRRWRHAAPDREERIGEWRIYHGELELPEGTWKLRDEVRSLAEGLLECRRRWEWHGAEVLPEVTLSVRWRIECQSARPFLPGISYYDNPAGAGVDAARIPIIGEQPGDQGFYEEHRFPLPFACVEAEADGHRVGAALHSLPSPLAHGAREDLWWSLGLRNLEGAVELALLSGPVASNRQTGVVKARQRGFFPYPDAHLDVPPGAVFEKTFYVQLYPDDRRGSGFRQALWQSVRLFAPFGFEGFPDLEEVIAHKFRDSFTRWVENDRCAGVDAFPGENRPWIDLGWAGQSEALAYPLILLGDRFEVAHADVLAQKSLDFIGTSPFDANGFGIRYDYRKHEWQARRNPLSQAQAMNNMLNALRVARSRPGIDPTRWERFLRRACDFHASRIEKTDWHPKSTNEGFLMAPLAQASRLFDETRYLAAARKLGDHYGKRHLGMDEPYWGGTLDARCEDKEGAWAALQGFLALHEETHETKYLAWAGHAADIVISYVYVWDVPLPPGRLADHVFRTRGWTSVSVQNMHLDVYGVLCAPAIWRLGELTGREELKRMARLMVVACGQLVDPRGSQGEQIQQTNYSQHYAVDRIAGLRGDYVESWTVYWISAHFLTAAAQFEEMGVDWRSW